MKTILQYLNERYDEAWDYCIRCSKSYGIPKDDMEEEYAEAVRDCEIVHELIAMVKKQNTRLCECPPQRGIPLEDAAKLICEHKRLFKELKNN